MLPRRRLADRRSLRQSLDRLARNVDTSGMMEGLDRFEQQAFNLLLYGEPMAKFVIDQLQKQQKSAYWKILCMLLNALVFGMAFFLST